MFWPRLYLGTAQVPEYLELSYSGCDDGLQSDEAPSPCPDGQCVGLREQEDIVMINSVKISFLAVIGMLALLPTTQATTIFTLNQDGCTGTCGASVFGTVSLVQTTPTLVTVTETLAANEQFAGSGAGDALEFNVVGPITIGNITAGFGVGPAPDTASAFGTFLASVTCTVCQGGQAGNSTGPLSFTVTSASGVSIADFIANNGGFFFAADIVGSGNTGNVAAIGPGVITEAVPEPVSLSLVGAGLLGLGILKRRFSA